MAMCMKESWIKADLREPDSGLICRRSAVFRGCNALAHIDCRRAEGEHFKCKWSFMIIDQNTMQTCIVDQSQLQTHVSHHPKPCFGCSRRCSSWSLKTNNMKKSPTHTVPVYYVQAWLQERETRKEGIKTVNLRRYVWWKSSFSTQGV